MIAAMIKSRPPPEPLLRAIRPLHPTVQPSVAGWIITGPPKNCKHRRPLRRGAPEENNKGASRRRASRRTRQGVPLDAPRLTRPALRGPLCGVRAQTLPRCPRPRRPVPRRRAGQDLRGPPTRPPTPAAPASRSEASRQFAIPLSPKPPATSSGTTHASPTCERAAHRRPDPRSHAMRALFEDLPPVFQEPPPDSPSRP